MNSSEFGKITSARAVTINNYINNGAAKMVVRETLRFIDDNFRLQGWQGASFRPWAPIKRPGTILVKTGKLRLAFMVENLGNGNIRFYKDIPYGKVHNEGFNGSVSVSAHTRGKYYKAKASLLSTHKRVNFRNKISETPVMAHTRQMTIIQRQFAPIEGQESPVLNNAIIKELEREILNILRF